MLAVTLAYFSSTVCKLIRLKERNIGARSTSLGTAYSILSRFFCQFGSSYTSLSFAEENLRQKTREEAEEATGDGGDGLLQQLLREQPTPFSS
eukprot:768785-Hanusia_phi.AAC.6